jgi:hypothetical protein
MEVPMASILQAQYPQFDEASRTAAQQQNDPAQHLPDTDQKVEATWSQYFSPSITFHASTEVICPRINCTRKLVILTATAVPLLAFGFACYVNQISR